MGLGEVFSLHDKGGGMFLWVVRIAGMMTTQLASPWLAAQVARVKALGGQLASSQTLAGVAVLCEPLCAHIHH